MTISINLKDYNCFILCRRNYLDGKKPVGLYGDWNNALKSYDEANNWLSKGENIGLVLGHNLICIDVDNEALIPIIEKYLPTNTYIESTCSWGLHYIYRYDGIAPNKNLSIDLEPLGELRSNRQYIIISPSLAVSKRDKQYHPYKIIKDVAPAPITEKQLNDFLEKFSNEKIALSESPKTTGCVGVGTKKNGIDRSRYDFAKCCELFEKGYRTFPEIQNQMRMYGSSKWHERGNDYRLSVFLAAMRQVMRKVRQ